MLEKSWKDMATRAKATNHTPHWTLVSFLSFFARRMTQFQLKCKQSSVPSCNLVIRRDMKTSIQASIKRERQFSSKVCVVAVLTVCVCALSCLGVSDFPVVVLGLLWGISRILAAPIDGTEMTVPIM